MAERTESQGFYEMLWDCDHCDTRGLLGKSQRHCPECGAKQNPDKRYFPKEGEQVRVDGHKYVGADRSCPACSAPQSAHANNCSNCGSPLDGAHEVKGVATAVAPPPKRRRIWPWLVLVVGVLGLAGFGIWYRFLRTRSAEMVVASHRWERTIAVEEFSTRHLSSWRNEVPSDARMPVCHRKQRTTRQVPDGEECRDERKDKKDGTFEVVKKCKTKYRSEPVDDDWCNYSVQRWHQLSGADLKTSGEGMSPSWPDPKLPTTAAPVLGAKRQGKRGETLTLVFKGGQSCSVSDAVWRKYSDGTKVKLEVRASSGDVVCGSL